jgi:hypothetical protein
VRRAFFVCPEVFAAPIPARRSYNLGVRWFTRERDEDPDFDDWDAVRSGYWAYISSIRGGLPPDLTRFLELDLHDAVVDVAEIDLVQRTARIRFLAGDRASFIECRYNDADFGDSNLRNFELAVEARVPHRDVSGAILDWRPLAIVLHDEVALLNGRFQHSFLIDPLGDFAVTFAAFALSVEAAHESALPERNPRFSLRNQWTES